MKKKFRLVLDLKVKIKDKVKVKDREKQQNFELLLEEFVKDEQALIDLYKHWMLGDLQSDEHINSIERDIQVRNEKEIVKSLVKKLPEKNRDYFMEIFNRIDNSWFEELEDFFNLFSLLKFDKARFEMIKE